MGKLLLVGLVLYGCVEKPPKKPEPQVNEEAEKWRKKYEDLLVELRSADEEWGELKAENEALTSDLETCTQHARTLTDGVEHLREGLRLCDEIVQTLPSPQRQDRWWCAYSSRFQTATCQQTKQLCQERLAEFGETATCLPQPRAACFTLRDRMQDAVIARCFQSTAFCKEGRQLYVGQKSADISEVSACGLWDTKRRIEH